MKTKAVLSTLLVGALILAASTVRAADYSGEGDKSAKNVVPTITDSAWSTKHQRESSDQSQVNLLKQKAYEAAAREVVKLGVD